MMSTYLGTIFVCTCEYGQRTKFALIQKRGGYFGSYHYYEWWPGLGSDLLSELFHFQVLRADLLLYFSDYHQFCFRLKTLSVM